jgi:hypothetical protein
VAAATIIRNDAAAVAGMSSVSSASAGTSAGGADVAAANS